MKALLLRVVRRPAGGIAVDPRGTEPGRGAYVHRDPACFQAAIERGGLARVLRVPLKREDLATLRSEIEQELT